MELRDCKKQLFMMMMMMMMMVDNNKPKFYCSLARIQSNPIKERKFKNMKAFKSFLLEQFSPLSLFIFIFAIAPYSSSCISSYVDYGLE
jgi:hypothetical protein